MRTVYLENKKKNHYKFYKMTEISDTMFEVEWGKIGSIGQKRRYKMGMWNKIYNQKISGGYEKVAFKKISKKQATDHDIENKIKRIIDLILNYEGEKIPEKEQEKDLSFAKKCLYHQRESNRITKADLEKLNSINLKYKK